MLEPIFLLFDVTIGFFCGFDEQVVGKLEEIRLSGKVYRCQEGFVITCEQVGYIFEINKSGQYFESVQNPIKLVSPMTCTKCKDCRTPRCHPGFFGDNCTRPCNPNCRALPCASCSCEVCNGSGDCVNGCDAGWYGETCGEVCPENCFSQRRIAASCHQSNGSCVFGCAQGYYGDRCNMTCSERCLKSICKQTTSECTLGCVHGFGGDFCNEEAGGFGTDQVAGAVGGAFVVVLWGAIVIILICVIWRRRMKDYAVFHKSKHLYRNGSRSSSRRPLQRQSSCSSQTGHYLTENGCHGFEIDMPVGNPAIEAFNHHHSIVPYIDESPVHCANMTKQFPGEPEQTSAYITEYVPDTTGDPRVRFIADNDDGDGLRGEEDTSEVSEVWKPRKF